MCGRYVMAMRPSYVRRRLQEDNMPVESAPSDQDSHLRQSYNFAPGSNGLIYRADVPDTGAPRTKTKTSSTSDPASSPTTSPRKSTNVNDTQYKLQLMKWGLVPFWTKRHPDYSSTMRTINCRDDSLSHSGGMWNTMKQNKRCIVLCEGFYEWLKKDGGREKIPHYIKRKDGKMMCFAGLWDCVRFEDDNPQKHTESTSDNNGEDKLYTYTIITTDSNKQLSWLHDRMPVIFEPGSDAVKMWVDPNRAEWSKDLQTLLKPYEGELEIYPVDKAVGKVGNNSPSFIIPVDSKENKKNIANFFANQEKKSNSPGKKQIAIKNEENDSHVVKNEKEDPESNAPLPKSEEDVENQENVKVEDETVTPNKRKLNVESHDQESEESATKTKKTKIEEKQDTSYKTRSATTNAVKSKTPTKTDGSAKITSFFNK